MRGPQGRSSTFVRPPGLAAVVIPSRGMGSFQTLPRADWRSDVVTRQSLRLRDARSKRFRRLPCSSDGIPLPASRFAERLGRAFSRTLSKIKFNREDYASRHPSHSGLRRGRRVQPSEDALANSSEFVGHVRQTRPSCGSNQKRPSLAADALVRSRPSGLCVRVRRAARPRQPPLKTVRLPARVTAASCVISESPLSLTLMRYGKEMLSGFPLRVSYSTRMLSSGWTSCGKATLS
jgi:hypothetical protein